MWRKECPLDLTLVFNGTMELYYGNTVVYILYFVELKLINCQCGCGLTSKGLIDLLYGK